MGGKHEEKAGTYADLTPEISIYCLLSQAVIVIDKHFVIMPLHVRALKTTMYDKFNPFFMW